MVQVSVYMMMNRNYQKPCFCFFVGFLALSNLIDAQPSSSTPTATNQAMPADFFLSQKECLDRLKVPFRLEAKTEFNIQTKSSELQGSLEETQRYFVTLEGNGIGDFHVKYQTDNLDGKQKAGGEAIWVQNQYYRRLWDTPFIHRKLERGELERFFGALDQTGALLELVKPYARIQKGEPYQKEGRALFTVQWSLNGQSSMVDNKSFQEQESLKWARKQWRKRIKVNEIDVAFVMDEQTKAPMSITLRSSFEEPTLHKRVTVQHTVQITFLKEPVSIQAPSFFREEPLRKRYNQQEQRKFLEKRGGG